MHLFSLVYSCILYIIINNNDNNNKIIILLCLCIPCNVFILLYQFGNKKQKQIIIIMAAGKVPLPVSVYLAGGKLVALNKFREGQTTDVRPIAVGETLRRLTGKCLCTLLKGKFSSFFQPFQFRGCLQGRGGKGHPQP